MSLSSLPIGTILVATPLGVGMHATPQFGVIAKQTPAGAYRVYEIDSQPAASAKNGREFTHTYQAVVPVDVTANMPRNSNDGIAHLVQVKHANGETHLLSKKDKWKKYYWKVYDSSKEHAVIYDLGY